MRNLRGARLHERNEKISKKLKFPLDKLPKVCYNKDVPRGTIKKFKLRTAEVQKTEKGLIPWKK